MNGGRRQGVLYNKYNCFSSCRSSIEIQKKRSFVVIGTDTISSSCTLAVHYQGLGKKTTEWRRYEWAGEIRRGQQRKRDVMQSSFFPLCIYSIIQSIYKKKREWKKSINWTMNTFFVSPRGRERNLAPSFGGFPFDFFPCRYEFPIQPARPSVFSISKEPTPLSCVESPIEFLKTLEDGGRARFTHFNLAGGEKRTFFFFLSVGRL